MKQKVILDVDTGYDDAVALLLAGHHPAIDLVAVTVTHGNAPLSRTLDNTLRVLQAGGLAHVPVYAGAERALVAGLPPTDPLQQLALDLPPATISPQPERAAEFLIDYYLGPHGAETMYLPLGPQTNLALALRLEPRLASRLPQIVTMAGAYLEGNVTPSAEFNIFADPEAAHIVFSAGRPITMIGLEVTAQALVTLDDVARLKALKTPQASVAVAMIELSVQWWKENMNWDGGQIYDACAVAAVIAPDCLHTQPMSVEIELHGTHTRGRTVADISGWQKQPPNVRVGVSIQRERFLEILLEGLGR